MAGKKKYRINKWKMVRRLLLMALLIWGAVWAGGKLLDLGRAIPEKIAALYSEITGGIKNAAEPEKPDPASLVVPDYVDVQLIDPGKARSGRKLETVNDIVVHYVGNPGTTGQNNRNYFADPKTEVCSHFVIGLDGEIIQCVPLGEVSAASNNRNKDTISIECCHPETDGKFTDATYDSLVKLTAWLCDSLMLDSENVIRHHDVTGKVCPKYFVEHEDAWLQFRKDVKSAMN